MYVCRECGRGYQDGGFCSEDGAALAPAADPLLGTAVGRWRLARVLGEGGMGRVYLGVQPSIGGRVAIKVLSEACARDRELVERFFAEARAVNVIRHESIVNVLDLAWLDDGRPYIVMEFVEGATLGALARQGVWLPIGSVARVAGEVLAALAAAHQRGIIHRDLKPDNVLVTREGHAKVLDFGIAKLAPGLQRGDSPRTATGALLGTPDYMAPEQIQGKPVDGRTDLYAAGVMLHEALTGHRPFHGESLFELLRAHLEQQAPPLRSIRPDVPVELEAVIARAMAKQPDARFASAVEMAEALVGATAMLPHEAWAPLQLSGAAGSEAVTPRVSPPPRSSPIGLAETQMAPRRSGKALVIALGCAVVAALIAVVVVKSGSGSGSDSVKLDNVTLVETGGGVFEKKPDYDPKNFDARGYLPKATALARTLIADAALVTFDVDGVYPDGHADLTLSEDFDAVYYFRGASLSKRPSGVPKGVEVEIPCMVHVYVKPTGIEAFVATHEDCTQPLRPPPRCTLAQVWQRAADIGAPTADHVAQIDYLWDGWFVQIGDDFTESLRDDC